MSGRYKVVWSSVAENDLRNILEYIAADSKVNALNIFKKIRDKASSLYFLPERGRIVAELKMHGIVKYREIIVSPWRIIYKISGDNVYVLSVIDSRRNIEDILLKRLTDPRL